MKKSNFLAERVSQYSRLNRDKRVVIFIYCLLSSICSYAQPYTNFYIPPVAYSYDNHEAYIIQHFTPTGSNNFEGTVMVQSVKASNNFAIQITLVDNAGLVIRSFTIYDQASGPSLGNFTPTCAAYNAIKHEYCIAGINEGNSSSTAPKQSWFLFLDGDLTVINSFICGASISGISPYDNLFVTDVCSVEGVGSLSLGDFAYVGVAGNSMDPSPLVTSGSVDKVMYSGYASSSGMGAVTRAYDCSGSGYDNSMFFPSRIIEMPMSNPDGGFMITGNGPSPSTAYTTLFL